MPAAGKDNAASIAKRQSAGETVRILITDNTSGKHASPATLAGEATPSRWYPSSVKTKVVTATVTGWSAVAVGGGRRSSRRYTLHTDKGDVPGLAPIETLWLAPPGDKPAPAAPAAENATVIARRSTMREARQHFEAGGTVLVSEHGHKETIPVFRHTTTHNRTRITWDELTALVNEWRNRYPNQRYYIVPAETAPADDDKPAPAEPEPVPVAGPVFDLESLAPMARGRLAKHLDREVRYRRQVMTYADLYTRALRKYVKDVRKGDGARVPEHRFVTAEEPHTFIDVPKMVYDAAMFARADIEQLDGVPVVSDADLAHLFGRSESPEPLALNGKWLRRKDDTYGQVATVEPFRGALGGDECADIEYTDGTRERYLARDLPAPIPDDEARKLERRVGMWAGKFMAETTSAEPPRPMEPTDEALAEVFAYSPMASKLPPLFPAIRAEIARVLAENPPAAEPALAGPVYAVGDRVTVPRTGREDDTGIVTGVLVEPGQPVFYDVYTIPAGNVPVTEDEMEAAPVPQPGQRWISHHGGRARVLTVVGPAPDQGNWPHGLVSDCEEVRGILLGAPHWRPLDEDDEVEVATARRCALERRPDVAAILERAGKLTGKQRERLHTVALRSYQMHREAHIQLGHQARRAYGENWHDLGQLADRARQVVASSADESTADRLSFAGHAAADAVFAVLVREHLNDNEYRIFAGPWLDVIGG